MTTATSQIEPSRAALSGASFENLVQHWAQARIDGPLEVIRRFDEAAKQLIALGGVLQGLFFAVLALGDIRKHLPAWAVPGILAPLVILVFCAARVICTVPMKMEAIDTYLLIKQAVSRDAETEDTVTAAIQAWCRSIDGLAHRKHKWLFAANMAFLLSSLAALLLLGFLVRYRY